MDSHTRLRLVAGAAGLTLAEPPTLLPSDSNDAWKVGGFVLRVCWRGDRHRLERARRSSSNTFPTSVEGTMEVADEC